MRGAAPLAVATLLRRGEMYGYELCAALEKESGKLLDIGQSTVYTLLYSLEQRTGDHHQAQGAVWPRPQVLPFDALRRCALHVHGDSVDSSLGA